MDVFLLLAFYICTFGILAFSVLLGLNLKEFDRRSPMAWIGIGLSAISLLWFITILVSLIPSASLNIRVLVRTAGALAAHSFPTLIALAFYWDRRPLLPPRRFWNGGIAVSVMITSVGYSMVVLHALGVLSVPHVIFGISIQANFTWTALFCYAVLRDTKSNAAHRKTEIGYRKRIYWLFTLVIFVPFLFYLPEFRQMAALIMFSMPLCFVFVSLYYYHRHEFFDLVVKRGIFFLLIFGLSMAFFTVVPPLLDQLASAERKTVLLTLAALPGALALPALYARLSRWLDRRWLGRKFSPVDAAKHFLTGMRRATDEDTLVRVAQERLGDIFQAPARIELGVVGPPEDLPGENPICRDLLEEELVRAPIRGSEEVYGLVAMGERRNRTPYFAEDRKLLATLADFFARLLENVRLQERRKIQERRERDLRLHASQSELKVLRAQINPHFLFNALNAVADLIYKDPRQAEDTVERLADVFRYTLRRSQEEWVPLEGEMEFVSAYLEVEKARYGSRLATSVKLSEGLGGVQVPGMIVQTLAENAVKHGISACKGRGRVEVEATRTGHRLLIAVRDNGPGFDLDEVARDGGSGRGDGGFGLSNIRRRLEGYFGSEAGLGVRRIDGMTEVSVEMPISEPSGERAGS